VDDVAVAVIVRAARHNNTQLADFSADKKHSAETNEFFSV
jgi:hypothetical protein